MTPIIVLDSSDEETDPSEKNVKKVPGKVQQSKTMKRNLPESFLNLKKPEWNMIHNNRLHEAPYVNNRIEKPQAIISIKDKPSETCLEKPETSTAQNISPSVSPGIKSKKTEKQETITVQNRSPTIPPGKKSKQTEQPETSTSSVQFVKNSETPNKDCSEKAECSSIKPPSRSTTPQQSAQKRKLSGSSSDNSNEKPMKRIKPMQISEKVDHSWVASQSPVIAIEDDEKLVTNDKPPDSVDSDNPSLTAPEIANEDLEKTESPINPTFSALLDACKAADNSPDMEALIKNKLLKYYHSVHPDFVDSKGFCKTVKAVTNEIQTTPQLVYYNLKTIVEELKIRRKSKNTVMSNEDVTTTGSEKKDRQVKRLSRALYIVTKKISKLEEADADLDDDNSSYLQCERYKKRACEIYEMICDLTGESKHAHRLVKKPISFRGTSYPEFNRTLQAFVNRTNTFPDFFDVYKCLEHCNSQYCFGLKNDEIRRIAQDAFVKIGRLLQNRRKTDLYETVSHFTRCSADPAESDSTLNAKLQENQKFHAKISSLIDRFAKEQEVAASENEKNKEKSPENNNTLEGSDNSNGSKKDNEKEKGVSNQEISKNCLQNGAPVDLIENGKASPDVRNKSDEKVNSPSTSKQIDNIAAPAAVSVEEIIILDEEDS